MCKVPFRWEAAAAEAAADPAKVSIETNSSEHGRVKRQVSRNLEISGPKVCEWETHPPAVPLLQT